MHGSSKEPIRSDAVVVGSGAFHCLYCLLQSHRAGGLESLLSMEYVWPKDPMVVVGIATKRELTVHEKNEQKNERTNEPRDDIFSQRNVLLGCYCYCRRSCVLVGHGTCRCPKIFLLLLLLLRPPKLHVQWSSTFSIIQTEHLTVKK